MRIGGSALYLFPALRTFWFLEKKRLIQRVNGTVVKIQITQNSTTNTSTSQKLREWKTMLVGVSISGMYPWGNFYPLRWNRGKVSANVGATGIVQNSPFLYLHILACKVSKNFTWLRQSYPFVECLLHSPIVLIDGPTASIN